MADAGEFEALAADLIEKHYDPAYQRADKRDSRAQLGRVDLPDLSAASLEAAAGQVAALCKSFGLNQTPRA
jgi:tRNA 2-selenouridine synthase